MRQNPIYKTGVAEHLGLYDYHVMLVCHLHTFTAYQSDPKEMPIMLSFFKESCQTLRRQVPGPVCSDCQRREEMFLPQPSTTLKIFTGHFRVEIIQRFISLLDKDLDSTLTVLFSLVLNIFMYRITL